MKTLALLFVCSGMLVGQTTSFTVTESGFAYFLNGEGPNPSIELQTGIAYTFQGSGLPGSHPFAISTSSSSVNVPAGVSVNSITGNDQLIFTPTATGTFFYVCAVHFFFGQITVVDAPTTSVDVEHTSTPLSFALHENFPNPFNPSTRIIFDLPEQSDVKVSIVNVLGQKIADLLNSTLEAGRHGIDWTAATPSGVYYYRLEAVSLNSGKQFTAMRRMVLLK